MTEQDESTRHPLPPPPQVVALNVCDGIWVDPWTQKKTLIGLFSVVQAQQFPALHPIITIHAALTNGRGSVKLKLRLIDADEERPPLFEFEQPVEFPDPRVMVDVQCMTGMILFPTPGEYRVQLLADGELLSERRIIMLGPEGTT